MRATVDSDETNAGSGTAYSLQLPGGSADPRQRARVQADAIGLLAHGGRRLTGPERLERSAIRRHLRDDAAVRPPVDVALLRQRPEPKQPPAGGRGHGDALQERPGPFRHPQGPALAAVEARLPKAFHGGSWDAFTTGMMAEAERFLVGVEALCRASIAV